MINLIIYFFLNALQPNTGGYTCATSLATAATLDGSSEICAVIQLEEATCCPPVSCDFCKETGVNDPDFVIPGADGTTCGLASEYAATLDGGEDMCGTVKFAEAICCPGSLVPCSFCPNGVTYPSLIIAPKAGTTCEDVMGYAFTVPEDDEMCSSIQLSEELCCPEEAPPALPTSKPTLSQLKPEVTEVPSTSPVPADPSEFPTMMPSFEETTKQPPSRYVLYPSCQMFQYSFYAFLSSPVSSFPLNAVLQRSGYHWSLP